MSTASRPSGDITKTYPLRGPLQQYRLSASTSFSCHRCGQQKTSKLLATVDGQADRLLCNGCYGRLVSIWDIKAGRLPDDQRDRALLELLEASVTADQVKLDADPGHQGPRHGLLKRLLAATGG